MYTLWCHTIKYESLFCSDFLDWLSTDLNILMNDKLTACAIILVVFVSVLIVQAYDNTWKLKMVIQEKRMVIVFYDFSREAFNGIKRWGVRRLFLLLSLFVISFGTRANFMIYPISKDIHGGGSELIRIYSKSTDTQYIKIYAKRITNPGTREESEVDVANWKDGMVVTPGRLILPAGSSKSVRLTQVKTPATEEVYRVYFESVKPEKKEYITENKSLKTDLSVNIIYAALVRALPENPKVHVNASVSPEKNIVINNAGNIRVGVKDIYFCRIATVGNDCVKKSYNKNIYPGNMFDTIVNKEGFAHIFIETNNNESAEKEGEVIHLTIP